MKQKSVTPGKKEERKEANRAQPPKKEIGIRMGEKG